MSGWYLNRALTNFRNEVNSRWPNRDKKSDGTIGDLAHSLTSSDHNPDGDGSVDAWDMDKDGVDVNACKKAFEAHPAAKYWIHQDKISFKSEGWKPRSYAYAGPNRNRHDQHIHWNSDQRYENSNLPWFTEDEDMTEQQAYVQHVMNYRTEAIKSNRVTINIPAFGDNKASAETNQLAVILNNIMADLDALKAAPPGSVAITDEQLERVLTKVLGSLDNK